jgi:Sigma-70 region 3
VLASCENAADVAAAQVRGYATALVVVDYADRKLYEEDGVNVLPCPAQTKKDVTCSSCGLCMDSERLRAQRLTIGFAVHGTPLGQRRARLALADPDDPNRRLSSRVLIPRVIESFTAEHGREPTNAEIANAIGISPSSVWQMRRRLADEATAGRSA